MERNDKIIYSVMLILLVSIVGLNWYGSNHITGAEVAVDNSEDVMLSTLAVEQQVLTRTSAPDDSMLQTMKGWLSSFGHFITGAITVSGGGPPLESFTETFSGDLTNYESLKNQLDMDIVNSKLYMNGTIVNSSNHAELTTNGGISGESFNVTVFVNSTSTPPANNVALTIIRLQEAVGLGYTWCALAKTAGGPQIMLANNNTPPGQEISSPVSVTYGTLRMIYDNSTHNVNCTFDNGGNPVNINMTSDSLGPGYKIVLAGKMNYMGMGEPSGDFEAFFDDWEYGVAGAGAGGPPADDLPTVSLNLPIDGATPVNSFSSGLNNIYYLVSNSMSIPSAVPDRVKDESAYTADWDTDVNHSFYIMMNESQHKIQMFVNNTDGENATYVINVDGNGLSGDASGNDFQFGRSGGNDIIKCWNASLGSYTEIQDGSTTRTCGNVSGFDSNFLGNFTVFFNQSGSTYEIVLVTDANVPWLDKIIAVGDKQTTFMNEKVFTVGDTSVEVNFKCGVLDDVQLANVSLYLTNSTDQSFALNQTTAVGGTSNETTWTLNLTNGNYAWNCLAVDNASQSQFANANYSLVVDYLSEAAAGTITVTYPNGNENWNKGESYDITWTNTSGVGDNVKLELYKYGGLHANIVTTVANTNSYTWVVPSTVDDDYGYKVKISDVSTPSTNDLSDGDFSIGAAGNVDCGQYGGITNQQTACEADSCTWQTSVTDSWCPFDAPGGCCLQKECWQFDGNSTACTNMTLNGGLNCIWDEYASHTDPDGNTVTGLCFNDFQGGEEWGGMADGCWKDDADKNTCQSAENAAKCSWKPNNLNQNSWCWIKSLTDAQNENSLATIDDVGCCDMKGCFDYNGNQTKCENNAALSGLCTWSSKATDPYCPDDVGCCINKWCGDVHDETNCTKLAQELYMPCEWSEGQCQDIGGNGGFAFFNDTDSCMNQGGWYNSDGECEMPSGNGAGGGAAGFLSAGDAHCWFADNQPGVCGNITGCAYCVAGSGANGVDNSSNDNICKDVQVGWCEGHDDNGPTYANADNTVNLNCTHIQLKAACNYGPLPNCVWSNSSTITGAFCEPGTSTERKADPPAKFCEDPIAKNNYTICMELQQQFMMPCIWDNETFPVNNCTFNGQAVFGSGGETEFEIINNEFSCSAAGGTWNTEYYLDGDVLKQDSWCEMTGFFDLDQGQGQNNKANCDTSCWACEFQNNGTAWASSAAASTACTNSALGNCQFETDSSAFNGFGWCDYPQQMGTGGVQDCDTKCGSCNFMNSPQSACEASQANGGTGCKWVSEGTTNFCVDKTKKTCDSDCFTCFNTDACQNSALGCTWDTTTNLCSPEGFTGEVCFDGVDNDADNMVDCADPDCGFDNFCGAADIGGDCFAQSTEGDCTSTPAFEGLNCSWINDTWNPDGWCDMPGANCWVYDNDLATCGATPGCTNQSQFSGSVCDMNKTAMDTANCWEYSDNVSCSAAPGECSWVVDPYCQENPGDTWCQANPNAGFCEYTPFASCMSLDETACDADATCLWKSDEWSEMSGGWCDVACFNPDVNQATCEAINGGSLCEWRDMSNTCQPEMFMMMNMKGAGGKSGCPQYDGNLTGCLANDVTCTYQEDEYSQNNVSVSEPSGWCMEKGEFNMMGDRNDFAPLAMDPGNAGGVAESGVTPVIDMDDLIMISTDNTYGFAAGVFQIEDSIMCNGYMVGGEFGQIPVTGTGNATTKFYYYLDTDGSESGGCSSPLETGSTLAGFEFLISYVARNTSSGLVETKQLLTCVDGGWNPTNVMVTTPKMQSCGFTEVGVSVSKQDLEGFDSFDTTANMRVLVTSADDTDTRASPSDSVGPGYYTQGTINFGFVDCNNPDNAQDPKCKNFQKFGFNIFEECKNGIDDDENGLVDCLDPFCSFIPDCASGAAFNFVADVTDKTAPVVMFSETEKLSDSAFMKVDTSEPSNMSVEFYLTDSSCTTLNTTVSDVGASGYQENADFKPFHNVDLMLDTLGYDLTNNTAYYYKVTTCDPSGNCGTSACANFTTKPLDEDKVFIFKMDLPDGYTVDIPALNKTDYNFTEEFNISGTMTTFDVGIKTNTSVTKDMNMTVHCGDMVIGLYGINMLKPTKIDMTNAFVCDESEDLIGMNSTSKKWNKLVDDLHLGGASDYIELTLPTTYSATNTLSWTDDTGANGEDVDDYVECSAGDTAGTTACKVPVSMGFSAYTITTADEGGDEGGDSSSSGGSGGGGGAILPSTTETIEDAGEDVPSEDGTDTETEGTGAREDVGATDVTEEVAEETGRAALAGMAWSDFGQAIASLTWLWVAMAIVAIIVGLVIYIKRRN